MSGEDRVVRLIDRHPGFSTSNQADLLDWALSWLVQLEKDKNVRTLVIAVETMDGDLYRLAQSCETFDRTRLLGLLQALTHRINCGDGHYPENRP